MTTDPTDRTRIIEGAGALDQLGACAQEFGGRALLVTDAGLMQSGHVDTALECLSAAGVQVTCFDGVHEDPSSDDVARCLEVAQECSPAVLIGFGGGSSIDVAKGVNLVLCCGGSLADFEGRHETEHELLPLIAVPTTAGTGTEAQSFALIGEPDTQRKMACGDPKLAPRVAILDARLTLTMPAFVSACTGLDAIAHAVEAAVTSAGNPVSTRHALDSFALSARAFPRIVEQPDDLAARGEMLRAANLAGRAIENSMLGAAHSMANPLSAQFGLPHGQAVAMALPVVVQFNSEDPEVARLYGDLAAAAGIADGALVERLSSFLDLAGLPRASAGCGVSAVDSPGLAQEAASQWTARYNPRAVGTGDFEMLFDRLQRGKVVS